MKNLIIIALASFVLFSCPGNENAGIIGKWKLTEELIDIGDGKGDFKEAAAQQSIEFFRDGTFTSTSSLCPAASGGAGQGTGTYSMEENKITPADCTEAGRNITFELNGRELILNLPCIEPCKQKYVRVD